MILFLGLRVEEPEELYHRNPVFEGARGYGMQPESSQMKRVGVIFLLHKPCLCSARVQMPTPHCPPAAVRRILRKLGADIRDARRRRRLPMAVVADRAFTSRSTLQKGRSRQRQCQHRHLCRRPAGTWPTRWWARSPISRATALAKLWLARSCRNASASCPHRGRLADIEVYIDIEERTRPVGPARSSEAVVFEYAPA